MVGHYGVIEVWEIDEIVRKNHKEEKNDECNYKGLSVVT